MSDEQDAQKEVDEPIIGIDLGTTNSVVAIYEGGEAKVIENAEGDRTTPSVVAFDDDGQKLVGAPAKRQAVTNNENTVESIKRHMGEDYTVELQGEDYTPEQISAFILQKLKQDAEEYLGQEAEHAVITVPAYFNDAQRQATQDAGEIAGLNVLRIINEPTAASMAYGLEQEHDEDIAVYDLGGGTFDISILEVGDDVVEVLSTGGDTELGGDDFDQEIINWLADDFEQKHGVDLRDDPMALQRLKEAAEEAKIELSATEQTNINEPYITSTDDGPLHLDVKLSRAEFEQMIEDYIDDTIDTCEATLSEAGLTPDEIDEVVLVGGSTRIPAIQDAVSDFFEQTPHKGVNPDEVVAVGAAIQAGVLGGDVEDILLLDVIPLSLGVETQGGVFTKLIEKNTTIPTEESEIFTTAEDNQTEVTVHVLQGERELAQHNKTLGRFHLTGIPPAPAGQPQIEVTFDIDSDGVLNVTAEDKATGESKNVEITDTSNLDEGEIEEMKQEAEEHAEEDKRMRELIEAKNRARRAADEAQEMLDEHGDSLDDSQVDEIEEQIETVEELAEDSEDKDEVESAVEALSEKLQVIGQQVYDQQQAPQGEAAGAQQPGSTAGGQQQGGTAESGPGADEDVQDADYEVVDDEEGDDK